MANDSGDIKLNIFIPHSSSSIKSGKKAAKQRQLQYDQRTKRRRRYRGGKEKQTNSTFKRFAAKSDRPSPQAKDQKSDFATFVPKKDPTKKVTFADIDGDEAPKKERKPNSELTSFVKRNAPLKRKKGDVGLVKKAKTSLKEQPAEFASFVKAGNSNKKKKVPIQSADDEDEPFWRSRKRKSADAVDDGEDVGEAVPRKARKAGDGVTPHRGKVTSLFGNNPDIPDVPRRAVRPVQESVFSNEEFSELPIHSYSVANLRSLGLTRMTTVQRKAAPELLAGRDALVRSQTGSGKTLAYALPLVELLQRVDPPLTRADGVQALIVLPTRELALQTYEWLLKLVKPFVRLVPGYLVGGEKLKSEKARLRKGVSILVGTPGRLMDHVQNTRCLRLDRVRCLVLDEADCMLDMGYERDVASLVSALDSQSAPLLPPEAFSHNRKVFSSDSDSEEGEGEGEAAAAGTPELGVGKGRRQTVLLSATLTPAVERLAGLALRSPVFVDAADETTAEHDLIVVPESLEQSYVLAPAKLRLVTLAAFILSKCKLSKERKMLLFCATQDMVDYLTELLTSVLGRDGDDSDDEGMEGHLTLDIDFFRLQGSMDQKERVQVFQTFRAAKSGVLLCTDVAARGLDLPRVDWTVQYSAPASVAAYVHRVGRAARVGAPGSALLFLAPSEVDFVQMLQDRRIRLKEETVERCLQQLALVSCSGDVSQKALASPEAAATALQQRFENVVLDRRSLHTLACKAYVSFVRFYASYPLEVRDVFNFKALHLGHYAKSFALRDPPTAIAGIGRRQYLKEREQQSDGKAVKRKRKPTGAGSATAGGAGLFLDRKRTRELLISEFSSGLEPKKKKKKNPGMPNM